MQDRHYRRHPEIINPKRKTENCAVSWAWEEQLRLSGRAAACVNSYDRPVSDPFPFPCGPVSVR